MSDTLNFVLAHPNEAADRIEALEAALREIETAPVRFDDGSLGKIDVPYGRGIIKGLESSADIARAALAPKHDECIHAWSAPFDGMVKCVKCGAALAANLTA